MGYIYKITNLINNKIYIGYTTTTIEERWKEHKSEAYDFNSPAYYYLLKKAIRKYGEENFKVEQIDEAKTIKELKNKEIYWISYFHSYAFDEEGFGYNMTRGGDGGSPALMKPVIQYNIYTGEKIKEFDCIKDAAEQEKSSGGGIDRLNLINKDYCFLFKEEVENLTEKEIKEKIDSLHPYLVYQLDLEGNIINIFRNIAAASSATGYSHGNLITCLNGQRRMAYDYQWVYQKDIKNRKGKPVAEPGSNKIAVVQYNLNGEKIREWESAKMAADNLNISYSHISSCCKLQRNQTGGYQWRYAKDMIEKLEVIPVPRQVICLETNEIFKNSNQAAKHFGYSQAVVKRCCEGSKTTKPYHFAWYDKED